MARQPAIAARRPAAHLPAVFAVAAPTAAPSSSPPRARAAAGASRDWRQALTAAGVRCAEEPGPRDWSAEAAGGRSGRPEKHLAAEASPPRSAWLSSQRLTPGRGGYPDRRGAHWDFARPLSSSDRPSAPPVPSPATASLRAGPLRASALGLPTSEAARLLARPLGPAAPPPGAEPRPPRADAPAPPSWEGPRPPGCGNLGWKTLCRRHDKEVAEGQDAASRNKLEV